VIIRKEQLLTLKALAPLLRKAKPCVPPRRRIYAVGDVHGRADLLAELLGRIDADLKNRPIAHPIQVFLGDYIDRGPDSRQVIDLLVARREQHEMLCLKGNHEELASQVLSDPSVSSEWRYMGGINTLASYGVKFSGRSDSMSEQEVGIAFRLAFPESHRHFFASLVPSFTCGDFFFAHAGVRPGISLKHQREHDLLWIRDDFLLYEEDFGKIIVHGHTPTPEPDIRPNRINIDTGAYATGRLTCLVLEDNHMSFL
jgi:serine/threonine protein phosphatase 1